MNLSSAVSAEVLRVRSAWQFVGAAFQDGHRACESCPHRKAWEERHPYGEGFASESLNDCALGERRRDRPEDCPAYAAHLQQSAEQLMEESNHGM